MSLEILLDQSTAHSTLNARCQSLIVDGQVTTTALQIPTDANTGYVLSSDAKGNASWQPVGGDGAITSVAGDSTIRSTTAGSAVSLTATGNLPLLIIAPPSSPITYPGRSLNGSFSGCRQYIAGGSSGAWNLVFPSTVNCHYCLVVFSMSSSVPTFVFPANTLFSGSAIAGDYTPTTGW